MIIRMVSPEESKVVSDQITSEHDHAHRVHETDPAKLWNVYRDMVKARAQRLLEACERDWTHAQPQAVGEIMAALGHIDVVVFEDLSAYKNRQN